MDSTSYIYHMTGGMPIPELSAGVTFALIGLLLMTMINVRKGMIQNPNTADSFQWRDFGWGSAIRVIISTIITTITIFVSIRFATELVGKTFSMFYAFGVGMFIDKATQLLIKKSK